MNPAGMIPQKRIEQFAQHAAWLLPLIVYLCAAFPDIGFWDTGEMAVVSWIYGIAHPPGFPVYVAVGWLWTHLFDVGNIAWRMAVFSALCTAVSTCILYTVARYYTPALPALAVSSLFAFAEVTLTRGTRAEIHTAALLFSALCIVTAERARRGDKAAFTLLPIWAALGICTHPVVLWTIPGAALLAISRFSRHTVPERLGFLRRFEFGAAGAAVIGIAFYALIPLRSSFVALLRLDPTLQLGFPAGMPFWDYAHPNSIATFLWYIQGKQFAPQNALFAWAQWSAYPQYGAFFGAFLQRQFPIILGALALGALALTGVITMLRREPIAGCAYLLAASAGVPFAAAYAIEIDNERYLLASLWVCVLLVAVGVGALLERANPDASNNRAALFNPRNLAIAAAVGIMLYAGLQLKTNAKVFAQRRNFEGRDYITRVLAKTPSDAVIIAEWTYATPLAYAAFVEHTFGTRILVSAQVHDIADRLPQLARTHPLYLIDGDISGFSDPHLLVQPISTDFPRIVRLQLKSR